MKVLIFNRFCPANKFFSGLNRPGSRPPSNAGKGCATGKSHILEVTANNLGISKVMKLIYKTVVKWFFVSMPDHFYPNRFKLGKVTANRSLINGKFGYVFFDAVSAGLTRGRIIKQAFSVQSQKNFAAGHVFRSAIGLYPVPFFA